MWIRRAVFHWLFPAAVVLPVWLLVGWGVFQSGGWAFLWVLFIAMPSVLIGELAIALLIRARSSVREMRMVSWQDVIGLTVWHALTIAVGFFPNAFGWILVGAIVGFLGLFWSTVQQLWRESRSALQRAMDTSRYGTGRVSWSDDSPLANPRGSTFVIAESPRERGEARD